MDKYFHTDVTARAQHRHPTEHWLIKTIYPKCV